MLLFAALALLFVLGLGTHAKMRGSGSDPAVDLVVAPTNPVAAETIHFGGKLATAVMRPVRLEYRSGATWSTLAEASTTRSGEFSLDTRAVAPSRTFRVFAPPVSMGRDEPVSYQAEATRSRTVRTKTATATVRFAAAPIGQSMDGVRDLAAGSARFTPPREGRKVMLQRRSGDSWQTAHIGQQNSQGSFSFVTQPEDASGDPYRFRVVAPPWNGAPTLSSRPLRPESARLLWQDEFSGRRLDPLKWTTRQPGLRNLDGDRACSESSPASVWVAGGRVHFRVKEIRPENPDFDPEADCEYGQFYNAHIGTHEAFSFRYGTMAARIKFHRHVGQHGGLWSQPQSSKNVPGDPAVSGAEIDAVEYFGDRFRRGAIQHTIYWEGVDETMQKAGGLRDLNHLLGEGQSWSNSYHVYSVEWTPAAYIFRVDGHETFRTRRGVSRTPQYLILSLLTSGWELGRLDKAKVDPHMAVDWVRVWR